MCFQIESHTEGFILFRYSLIQYFVDCFFIGTFSFKRITPQKANCYIHVGFPLTLSPLRDRTRTTFHTFSEIFQIINHAKTNLIFFVVGVTVLRKNLNKLQSFKYNTHSFVTFCSSLNHPL